MLNGTSRVSRRFPAVFMRGGTSKAVIFHQRHLPKRSTWDAIFLSAMGSPDPYGRQLDGMGGGISSLSKVCVIGPSAHPSADVDYTFAQVSVSANVVDYDGNCGNMASAVGPFAVDEGLVSVSDGEAVVRIHNTNTGKLIHSKFRVDQGRSVEQGDFAIPGVSGTGAPIRLDFLNPGGATTKRLLPSGAVTDDFETPHGAITVSMIDAANACVYVRAKDLGLTGAEMPEQLESSGLLKTLACIREQASVRMGIASSAEEAARKPLVPFVAIVARSADSESLSGMRVRASEMDVTLRVVSNGQVHRAAPLTVALCTSVAAAIEGTVVNEILKHRASRALRIGTPSGVLVAESNVVREGEGFKALAGSFYRTARRLFEGHICC